MGALLHKAEQLDAQEDGRYGKDKRGDELPQELQRRQERIEAIRKPRAELETEAEAEAEAEAAADQARQREQQAKEATQQVAEAETSQAGAKTREKAACHAKSRTPTRRGGSVAGPQKS